MTAARRKVSSQSRAPDDVRAAAIAAARAASEKQAIDIKILEVGELISITDFFVVCSGATERQVRTIVEEISKALATLGIKAIRREGEREGRWVLLDFGDVVAHVFAGEERAYYELERLWKDAPEIAWTEENASSSTTVIEGTSSASGAATATGRGGSSAGSEGRRRARI